MCYLIIKVIIIPTVVVGGYYLLKGIKGKRIQTPLNMRDPSKLRNNVVTFYFQGNNASRGQASMYAGPEGVKCITNDKEEKIISFNCSIAPRILHNIYMYKELDDLSYTNYNPFLLPLKFLSYYENCYERINGPSHITHITRWSVGGKEDVDQFLENIKKMIDNNSGKKIVVFGPSRGGATTLIGISCLPKRYQEKISLVIVESPFTTFPDVLNSWPCLRYLSFIQLDLLSRIGRYKHNQLTPLEAIHGIPNNIPLAFITSNIDKTVPEKLTLKLLGKVKERPNTYHCSLDNSHHIGMPTCNLSDQKKYYEFVEDLYKKYID